MAKLIQLILISLTLLVVLVILNVECQDQGHTCSKVGETCHTRGWGPRCCGGRCAVSMGRTMGMCKSDPWQPMIPDNEMPSYNCRSRGEGCAVGPCGSTQTNPCCCSGMCDVRRDEAWGFCT